MATWSATDSPTFPGERVSLANAGEHAPVVMFKIIVQLAPQSLLCMQMVVHNIIKFITSQYEVLEYSWALVFETSIFFLDHWPD